MNIATTGVFAVCPCVVLGFGQNSVGTFVTSRHCRRLLRQDSFDRKRKRVSTSADHSAVTFCPDDTRTVAIVTTIQA